MPHQSYWRHILAALGVQLQFRVCVFLGEQPLGKQVYEFCQVEVPPLCWREQLPVLQQRFEPAVVLVEHIQNEVVDHFQHVAGVGLLAVAGVGCFVELTVEGVDVLSPHHQQGGDLLHRFQVEFFRQFEQEAGEGMVNRDIVNAVVSQDVGWLLFLALADRLNERQLILGADIFKYEGDVIVQPMPADPAQKAHHLLQVLIRVRNLLLIFLSLNSNHVVYEIVFFEFGAFFGAGHLDDAGCLSELPITLPSCLVLMWVYRAGQLRYERPQLHLQFRSLSSERVRRRLRPYSVLFCRFYYRSRSSLSLLSMAPNLCDFDYIIGGRRLSIQMPWIGQLASHKAIQGILEFKLDNTE